MASNSTRLPTQAEIDEAVGLAYATEVFAPSSYHNMTMIAVIDKFVEENFTDSIAPLLPPGQPPLETLKTIQAVLHTLPHNSNGTSHAVAYGIVTLVAIIFVATRVYIRKYYTKQIRVEDWTAIVAMAFVTGLTVSNMLEAIPHFGNAGYHLWDLSVKQVAYLDMLFLPNEILFVLCHCFVKFTFITFYYSLIPSKKYRWWIKAVGLWIILVTTYSIVAVPLACNPVDDWNHLLTAKCFNTLAAFTANGVFYIATDVYILLLPIPAVIKLQLRTRDKIIVLCMFGAGAFICAVGIIRLYMLRVWLASIDFTYAVNAHDPWVFVELDLSMIISCLPALYKAILQKRGEAMLPAPAGMVTSGNYGQKKRRMWTRDTDIIATAARIELPESVPVHSDNEHHEESKDRISLENKSLAEA